MEKQKRFFVIFKRLSRLSIVRKNYEARGTGNLLLFNEKILVKCIKYKEAKCPKCLTKGFSIFRLWTPLVCYVIGNIISGRTVTQHFKMQFILEKRLML